MRDWEPASALLAGADGLDDIRRIVAGAPRWLAPGASVVVELAPVQADAAIALAEDAGLVGAASSTTSPAGRGCWSPADPEARSLAACPRVLVLAAAPTP